MGREVEIRTADGTAKAWLALPAAGTGPWPAIVMFGDALGYREVARRMADRLATLGYVVLFPDPFYRTPYAPFDAQTVFTGGGPELDRIQALIASMTDELAMKDAASFFDFLTAQPEVKGDRFGTVGYCMGGGFAVRAACDHSKRVAAAAGIHSGKFVTDATAEQVIATKLGAPVYLAVAEDDRRHTPEITARLALAMGKAKVAHTIDFYAGKSHGFAVPDLPPFNEAAAEKHWKRLESFFAESM